MPYYAWKGVNLAAQYQKGMHFASSPEELDALLLQREIALVSYKPIKLWFVRPITAAHKAEFFKHFAVLIQCGVPVPKALFLVSERISHKQFALIIQDIAHMVQEGVLLHDAMNQFPKIFNPAIITMVLTGLETGNLAATSELISHYWESRQTFFKSIRAAIAMPLMTLGFFCAVSLTLIMVLIPRFAELVQSMHKELPFVTQVFLHINHFLQGWQGAAILLFFGILILFLIRWVTTLTDKKILIKCALQVPLLKKLIIQNYLYSYFQSLALLISGGMPLATALHMVPLAIDSEDLRAQFEKVAHDVASGFSLSQTLASYMPDTVKSDICALIAIGEETGSLGTLLSRAAQMYQDDIQRYFKLITTFIQPILLLIIGFLVMLLVIALYMPIFNLSYMV